MPYITAGRRRRRSRRRSTRRRRSTKGRRSKSRRGRLDYETHKGDKVYHQRGRYVRKSRRPYSHRSRGRCF